MLRPDSPLSAPARGSLRSPRVVFVCLGTLLLGACANATTAPAVSSAAAVSTAPTPCAPLEAAHADDPLTLLGGELVFAVRVDVAAIRQSALGELAQSTVEMAMRAEMRGPVGEALLAGLERTDVFAFGLNPEHGASFVARGQFTEADLEAFSLDERRTRRGHSIQHSRRTSAAVVRGQYVVLAERIGVEGILDRLDGLEDPAPQTVPQLRAAQTMAAYNSYVSIVGTPDAEVRREMHRDRHMRDVADDIRWAGLSVREGVGGLHVEGRIHTVRPGAAATLVRVAEEVRLEVQRETAEEVPALSEAAGAVTLQADANDGVLLWDPSDADARAVLSAMRDAFERTLARRSQYESASATATSAP